MISVLWKRQMTLTHEFFMLIDVIFGGGIFDIGAEFGLTSSISHLLIFPSQLKTLRYAYEYWYIV